MKSTDSVCYNCPRRTAACHATCPDGIREAERNAARREAAGKARMGAYGVYDSRIVNRKIREDGRKDHWRK